MRWKYGEAVIRIDLCALKRPPVQTIMKSAVGSPRVSREAVELSLLVGGLGVEMLLPAVRDPGVI
jgi:hypothetical protein